MQMGEDEYAGEGVSGACGKAGGVQMCAGEGGNVRVKHEDDVRRQIEIIEEKLGACEGGGICTRGVGIIKGVG